MLVITKPDYGIPLSVRIRVPGRPRPRAEDVRRTAGALSLLLAWAARRVTAPAKG